MNELHEADLWLTLRAEAWPMTWMLQRHMVALARYLGGES